MKYLYSTIILPALALALAFGVIQDASANPVIAPTVAETLADIQALDEFGLQIVKVAHKRQRRGKLAQRNARPGGNRVARPHKRFHQRYRPRQKAYKRAHRKFHRHYGQRHRNPGVTIRVYPRYDPYYYNPYYYDPYYDAPYYPAPRARLSCARVRQLLRSHGYRKVRAYDCKGKVYNFYARYKGSRYKLRVSAYTGQVRSRVPY